MSSELTWHELIDRHLHGELSEAEKERLAEWLDSNPEARQAFIEQVHWDAQFSEAFRERRASLRDLMAMRMADPISLVQTTLSRERRSNRILNRSLLTAAGIAAAFLIICSLLFTLMRSQEEVTSLRHELELARHDAPPVETDESTIINIYAREHRDIVARHASLSPTPPESMQMQVNQEDILYYELLDGQQETMSPGIIVRRSPSPGQISPSPNPVISNGHTLTLSEAKEAANFDLVSPLWLRPCYRLDQIRSIEDRDALQLVYTNGINSISLFEQSLDGQRGLSHHDFKEYAVYNNTEQRGATILAWRDNAIAYVLIGNTELSELMDIAESISALK